MQRIDGMNASCVAAKRSGAICAFLRPRPMCDSVWTQSAPLRFAAKRAEKILYILCIL